MAYFTTNFPDDVIRTNITLNGSPGVGKSATWRFARKLEKEGVKVILNGVPLPEEEPGKQQTNTGNLDYLKNIYHPELKHKNFNNAMLVGFRLMEKERKVYSDVITDVAEENRRRRCEGLKVIEEVIFVWERDSMTAGNIFIRANQFNCLLDGNSRAEEFDINKRWEVVKVFGETIKAQAKELHSAMFHRTFLITMLGSARLCWEKVKGRGRPHESEHMSLQYCWELSQLHSEFAGLKKDPHRDFVEPWEKMYAGSKVVKHLTLHTDCFYRPEAVDEMKTVMADLMFLFVDKDE